MTYIDDMIDVQVGQSVFAEGQNCFCQCCKQHFYADQRRVMLMYQKGKIA